MKALKRGKMVHIFFMILALVVTGILTATPGQAEQIVLKFASPSPAGSYWEKHFIVPLVQAFEQRSNGRVKVQYFPAGQLASFVQTYDAAAKGLADFGYTVPALTPGRFPLTELVSVPFLYPNCVTSGAILREVWDSMLDKLEYKETKVLVKFLTIEHQIQTTRKKPVKTLEDLKGLKIRSLGGQTVNLLKALGAVPIPVSPAETYTALERGTVDGALFSTMAGDLFKFEDLKLNVTDVKLFSQTWICTMNLKKWNSLPADLQKEYEAIGYEFSCRAEELYHQAQYDANVKYRQAGCQIIPVQGQELAKWQAAVTPIMKKYVDELNGKGLPATDVWKKLVETCNKYNVEVPYNF